MAPSTKDALRTGNARLAAIVESAEDAIVSKSLDGTIESWNPAAERMFGYSASEIIGRNIRVLIPPDRQDEETLIVNRLSRGETLSHYESVRLRKDGSEVHVSLTVSPIFDDVGKVVGASKILRDIGLQLKADARIRALLRTATLLSGINSLIVRVADQATLFRQSCELAVNLGQFRVTWIGLFPTDSTGLEITAAAGAPDILANEVPDLRTQTATLDALIEAAVRTQLPAISNDVSADTRIQDAPGCAQYGVKSIAIFPLLIDKQVVGAMGFHAGMSNFFDEDEIHLLLELAGDIAFSINHLAQARRFDHLARFDPVTGLPNRAQLLELLSQRLAVTRAGECLAVIVIDLQRFRMFNDSFGRNAGDQLLREVAARCLQHKLEASIIGRIGPDQFAVVVSAGLDGNGIARIIEMRNQQVFGAEFALGDRAYMVSARYGVALSPTDGNNAESLLRNAESALQRARREGRHTVFYTADIGDQAMASLELERSLRRAIENEEFVLHYQPKVDAKTGEINCVEALIRWQSPECGLIPPSEFIPLLEETGMILPVGDWIVRKAAADWHTLRNSGLRAPRIAVNVSALQLRQPNFAKSLQSAISLGDEAAAIDIELTESLVMDDVERNIATLHEIRQCGIEIAIDDFGTGYSSLAYLAKLPVQVLKIDRGFINSIAEHADATALVSTMIGLAHSLSLKVVAEGVETAEQAKLLTLLRCDQMQGYLFGRSVPLNALMERLAKA